MRVAVTCPAFDPFARTVHAHASAPRLVLVGRDRRRPGRGVVRLDPGGLRSDRGRCRLRRLHVVARRTGPPAEVSSCPWREPEPAVVQRGCRSPKPSRTSHAPQRGRRASRRHCTRWRRRCRARSARARTVSTRSTPRTRRPPATRRSCSRCLRTSRAFARRLADSSRVKTRWRARSASSARWRPSRGRLPCRCAGSVRSWR